LFTNPLIIGSSAKGDWSFDLPTAENNILGTKYKIVTGYSGASEESLAIDSGEIQGFCGMGMPAMKSLRPDWVTSGFIKMLVQESAAGSPEFNDEGVPRTADFAKTGQDSKALELIYNEQKFGRPFAMPPGVPPDRVATLRKAFVQALQDKELLAEAKNMNLDIVAMSGQELQTLVDGIYETPADIVTRAKEALGNVPAQQKR
jgi:tripartite-type tricarboxylate transporter receptor subunit TctC